MRQRFSAFWLIVLIIAIILSGSFFAGFYFGRSNQSDINKITSLAAKEEDKPEQVDFSPFWRAWNIIGEKYIADNGNSSTTKKVTDQDKVWGAISGLTDSLGDPYSVFLPPEKKKRFEDDISGNFSGVGMEVGIKEEILTVIAPLPDSPAKRAGIQAGDKIIKIDETLTTNLSTDEAVGLIRGKEGTSVRLTLVRGKDKPFEIPITREIITVPTIETKKFADGVFMIRLYNFSAISPNSFRHALRQFVEAKSDKLIIDLRGNPGGFLDAAVDMASWFLPAGNPVVVEKHNDSSQDRTYRSRGYNIFNNKLKMVILIDRGSASASEILAGALSEYGKATLVGEKTFGKGSVQELVPVTSDSSIKITIAKWYTPQGHSISLNGLKPDIEVAITADDVKAERDPQLDRARQILSAK